jgi:hypothetical protein
MRRLYRMTLQRSEMDSTGQIAPAINTITRNGESGNGEWGMLKPGILKARICKTRNTKMGIL